MLSETAVLGVRKNIVEHANIEHLIKMPKILVIQMELNIIENIKLMKLAISYFGISKASSLPKMSATEA